MWLSLCVCVCRALQHRQEFFTLTNSCCSNAGWAMCEVCLRGAAWCPLAPLSLLL